jgi:5-methylcytosine-specific restriction endonuclease McrA
MTRRLTLTKAMRARIFWAHEGRCYICSKTIFVAEQWDVDHIKPLWLGGKDAESNMKPVHIGCHAGKTVEEAPVRAKSNRVRAKHLGLRKAKGRPMPGTKASGIRKRMSGRVEKW